MSARGWIGAQCTARSSRVYARCAQENQFYATIPLNAAGVAILIYAVVCGRQFDPWLRLIGASALVQHVVTLFYTAATVRYHFLTWFLAMLVAMVWFQQVGIGWLRRRYPAAFERFAVHPWSQRLASGLGRLQKVSA